MTGEDEDWACAEACVVSANLVLSYLAGHVLGLPCRS
jgi:hypothetical protein